MKPKVVYWNNIPSPYFVGRLNALQARGNVDLFAWFKEQREPDRSWNVAESTWHFRHAYVNATGGAAGFMRKLIAEKPDLLVTLYSAPLFIAGSLWAKSMGIPVAYRVLPTFDAWVKRSPLKELVKHALFRIADGVKVSGEDAARVASRYGVPSERIFRVTQSIDVEHYASARNVAPAARAQIRSALGLRGCVFIFVGRLWAGKGLDYLFGAYKRLSDEIDDVSLLVVGDGVDEARYRAMARDSPRVRLTGFIQPKELPTYYSAADAMVFPTLGDPHGLVVEEAMAAGLPVISTQAAGDISGRIPDGQEGFIVPAQDVNALYEKMRILAIDPAQRKRMGNRAAASVIGRDHNQWAVDFERFVDGVLRKRGRPSK